VAGLNDAPHVFFASVGDFETSFLQSGNRSKVIDTRKLGHKLDRNFDFAGDVGILNQSARDVGTKDRVAVWVLCKRKCRGGAQSEN
jgi:hypothetical protein